MDEDVEQPNLEACIYCGACFRYCILKVFDELDGMELRALVAGVTRIARNGPRLKGDERIIELLGRCTLQGYCDKVCPALVKPYLRNKMAKRRIEDARLQGP